MSKQRCLDTRFWDDSYIVERDPIEKLLFLYLLTNPLTNISGIYEISLKRIAFDTGIDQDMVIKILSRFENDQKIKYTDGFVALKNFIKHQKLNPKVMQGIKALLRQAPPKLVEWVFEDNDSLPIDYRSLWIDYDSSSIDNSIDNDSLSIDHANININKNRDLNRDRDFNAQVNAQETTHTHTDKTTRYFGEFKNVLLTEVEYESLKEKLGKELVDRLIENLSIYIASKGVKYKSHYATILAWAKMENLPAKDTDTDINKHNKAIVERLKQKIKKGVAI